MYCVIVGDIIHSKALEARERSTATLNRILEHINIKYARSILAPFGIVRGDAFEGVLFSQPDAPRIIQDILKALYADGQVRIRVSTAMGELSVVSPERNQADGEAFHIALDRIEGLRKNKTDHWFQVAMYTGTIAQPLVDGLLGLIAALTRGWTDKQTQAVWAMLDHNNQQNLAAKALGISPSVLSKQLKAANFEAYHTAWAGLEQHFLRQDEAAVTPVQTGPIYNAYLSLAFRKEDQEDFTGAIGCYEKALELAKELFGSSHYALASIYYALASAHFSLLDYGAVSQEESGPILDRLREYLDASLQCQSEVSKVTPLYIDTLNLEGCYYDQRKDPKNARGCFTRALSLSEDINGADHFSTWVLCSNLASAYIASQEYPAAGVCLDRLRPYLPRLLEQSPLHYAFALQNLAEYCAHTDRPGEARRNLEESLSILTSQLPPTHKAVIEAKSLLEALCGESSQ